MLTDQPYNLTADLTTTRTSLNELEVNSGSPVGLTTARPRLVLPTFQLVNHLLLYDWVRVKHSIGVRTFVAFHTTSLLQNEAQNSNDTGWDIKQGAHKKEHIQ